MAGREPDGGDAGVPRAAERLYDLPLERFVAERDALARELAGRGDPAAGIVRRLPRPTRAAWLLDRAARARPEAVRELLAAGDRLRRAQRRALSGGGADELREAEGALREAARTLRAAAAEAGETRGPALAELELALRAAAIGPAEDRERLRRGVLSHAPAPASGFGDLAGLTAIAGGAEGPSRAPPAAEAVRERRGAAAREGARERADREAREAREAERAAARERKERERARAEALRVLARAEKEVARRRTAVERAGAALAGARAALARAEAAEREARARAR